MNKIQRKVWLLAAVVLLVMSVIWIALTYYNEKTQNQYDEILQRYLSLNEVSVASGQVVTDLNNYLQLPSADNLDNLSESRAAVEQAKFEVSFLRNEENDFELTNYMNLIDSLLETTDRSLLFQSEQEIENSANEFAEATRISNYISEMTLTLLDSELKTYERIYRGIILQSAELKNLGFWLMLLITFSLLLMTYVFSKSITRPVHQLTVAVNELSKGRFNQQIEVKSNDEISFLAETFERMRININNLIGEIKEKAQLERELQQNKLLLQESQLLSLQSQINPHFLFNTLNILSKKAYLEGSEETSDLLVSVAGLLRYNLKRLDRSVTLYEEVVVLKQYMDIQKARFTDRLHFIMDVDESCLEAQLPGLTLQPVIENAVIHAIEPAEDGGTITVCIKDSGDSVDITVDDNGPGIPEQKIRQLLEGVQMKAEGHSTGIGFSNVIKRLRLFYDNEDVLSISSVEGKGTKISITIPKERRSVPHDEAPDRGRRTDRTGRPADDFTESVSGVGYPTGQERQTGSPAG